MEYNYPKFTPEMKKTHTILIPNMLAFQTGKFIPVKPFHGSVNRPLHTCVGCR